MKDNTPQRKIELLLIVSSILNAMTFKNKNKKESKSKNYKDSYLSAVVGHQR